MGAGARTLLAVGCGLALWLGYPPAVEAQAPAVAEQPDTVANATAPGAGVPLGHQTLDHVSLNAHVRPIKDGVFECASLLQEAERRSATIRRLVAALEQTDIVVYIELAPSVPNRSGRLTFMAANRAFRMFRISLDMRNQADDQIKWLGHELAHALEVALAPEVRTEAGMSMLFARIGSRVDGSSGYETYGAEETGRLVKEEISKRQK